MRTVNRDSKVMVFAKAPQPGSVKTRLIPMLGAAGATSLHMLLTQRALTTACTAGLGRVDLHCAPDTSDPFFGMCRTRYRVNLLPQSAGDLGVRMRGAFDFALRGARWAILIGSDCPALTVFHLRRAAAKLAAGKDAVFVPTEDGGYALIGLSRCDSRLFEDICWGESGVMNSTRRRLTNLGWDWHEIETLWDVDRPEDYRRLLSTGLIAFQ